MAPRAPPRSAGASGNLQAAGDQSSRKRRKINASPSRVPCSCTHEHAARVMNMSTVQANQLGQTLRLEYRSAPNVAYVDPIAENLAIAGTIFALLAWLLYCGLAYA